MSIIENTKEIAELVQKLGNIDLYRKIVALEGEVIEISTQKVQLEERVHELERSAKLKAGMIFREPVYFVEGDNTPFCPICFEKEERAIHLLNYGAYDSPRKGPTINWFCMLCKGDFYFPQMSKEGLSLTK